ncbi:FAD-dependent monooxygenase [Streptomyces sp. NBC_01235]|uniref:FAD-dependent monooxygenase n=1 Tax=Streptomyces sp. NBC_01235 TaxID=2903788 RepID=UPI002E0F2C98|nr:FAD-dependent monooxygenase [Streptomyces sp. NBC_01235]
MINPDERPEGVSDPDFIRALPAHDLWRASTYRFHALVLQRWRVRRRFLLGDAAHMAPPFLAQGMCQGIRPPPHTRPRTASPSDSSVPSTPSRTPRPPDRTSAAVLARPDHRVVGGVRVVDGLGVRLAAVRRQLRAAPPESVCGTGRPPG